jgi:hypothetical protein
MKRPELSLDDLLSMQAPGHDPAIDVKVGAAVQTAEDKIAAVYAQRDTYSYKEGGNIVSFLDAADRDEDKLPTYYPRHFAMIEAIRRRGLLRRYYSLDATHEFEGIDGSINWAVDMEVPERWPGFLLVTWINRDEIETTEGDGPNITRRVARQTLRYFPGQSGENVERVLSMMEDPEEVVKL